MFFAENDKFCFFLHSTEVSVLKNNLTTDCNWFRVLQELFVDRYFHKIVMYHPHSIAFLNASVQKRIA